MRACVLQGGGFSQSVHRHAFTLQHRTKRFKLAHITPYAAAGTPPRAGLCLRQNSRAGCLTYQTSWAHPQTAAFCVNQLKTNISHFQRLFPALLSSEGSYQLADVVLSLWIVSHLHTVTTSWLKLCSQISVVSVGGADVLCIQGWLMMSSKDGRSAGRRERHHLMSCWHSAGRKREMGK